MKNIDEQEEAFKALIKTGLNQPPDFDLEDKMMDQIMKLPEAKVNAKKMNALSIIIIVGYCLLTLIMFAASLWNDSALLSLHEFIPALPAWEWDQQHLLTCYYYLLGVTLLLSIVSLVTHAARSKRRLLLP
jgi:hypothetical protein